MDQRRLGQAEKHEWDRRVTRVKVKVLYFASARELASRGSESLTLPDGSSLKALVDQVLSLHPGLRPIRRTTRFTVNRELAQDGAVVKDGDEVGVLPPVAGG